MNESMFLQMYVDTMTVARVASTGESALRNRVRKVKNELLSSASCLPFSSNIKMSNISSYAKIIMKVTSLPSKRVHHELEGPTCPAANLQSAKKMSIVSSDQAPAVFTTNTTNTNTTKQEQQDQDGAVRHSRKMEGRREDSPEQDPSDDDEELDQYIRTDEEVKLYETLFNAQQ